MAITLVTFGVVSYYVAPLAFLLGNFSLLFAILNNILLLMIFGLSFLTMIVQPMIQSVVLEFLLVICWKDRKLRPLIHKNV